MNGSALNKEENMVFFDKFSVFSWSQMSDAVALFKALQKDNIDIEKFINAVDAEIEEKKQQIRADRQKKNTTNGKQIKKLKRTERQQPPPDKRYPKTLVCPKCGQVSYAQSVCPNCLKGKAGIKRQYICGECNFVFYLD